MTTTKKDLLHLLQSIYDKIPACTCSATRQQTNNQPDPNCHRHAVFTEDQIYYINIILNNERITWQTFNDKNGRTSQEDPTYP